jgi:hypothetical protein
MLYGFRSLAPIPFDERFPPLLVSGDEGIVGHRNTKRLRVRDQAQEASGERCKGSLHVVSVMFCAVEMLLEVR